ncbi:unnamed protein product [Echinostoma caproni]|uniref:HTH luxR-type domain-containing protein n=1 Tax=Echinostoma caproni TaxID=27848 RepID=A0A183AGC2_9TREM|nr:unnamed protein product [Echinostoma caproni]
MKDGGSSVVIYGSNANISFRLTFALDWYSVTSNRANDLVHSSKATVSHQMIRSANSMGLNNFRQNLFESRDALTRRHFHPPNGQIDTACYLHMNRPEVAMVTDER